MFRGLFKISTSARLLIAGIIILGNSLIKVSGQAEVVIAPHYLFPEFLKGEVLLKAGVTRELKMNYNLITEEMVFEYPGKYLALTNLETIDTVYIDNRKFVPYEKVFLELLSKGPASLFAKYTCSVIPPGKPAGYGGTSQTSSVTVIDQLFTSGNAYSMKLPDDYTITPNNEFFLIMNGEMVRVYNIKQVIKAFPEKESQIKEYNKNIKIDFKNREDLISLTEFCNK